jgi:hypothetical protein
MTDEGRALIRKNVAKQPVGQISVQPRFEKYFASPFGRNSSIDSNRPTPQRGVSRSSRTRGGMRWTRQRQARNVMQGGFLWACERSNGELTNDVAADGEVVWS